MKHARHTGKQRTVNRLEKLKEKRAQLDAEIERHRAADALKLRKQETARKIEVGALMLHHARTNPRSEVAVVLKKLLDEYVPKHRRHIFVDEFGISPIPPNETSGGRTEAEGAGLKAQFPGAAHAE